MPVDPNPFPLDIADKVDSWEKLQLLENIDPTVKVTAAELTKMVKALEYLYTFLGGGDEGISGNVPANFKNVVIDFEAAGTTHAKVVAAINALPNTPLLPGSLQIIFTNRIVLTNEGITNGFQGTPNYAVVREYFVITQKILPNQAGDLAIGTGGTTILNNGLQYFNTIDTRSYAPTENDLGDIGASDIWDAVDTTGPYSAPNGATILFIALQNGIQQIWLYIGDQEEIGLGTDPTSNNQYRLFDVGDTDPLPEYQETKPTHNNIANNNVIGLSNHEIKTYFIGGAENIIEYTYENEVLMGKALLLINAPSQPKITNSIATVAGSFIIGFEYTIKVPGNTDFTLIGAADNNVGTVFVATGVGAGPGTATQNAIQVGGNAFVVDTDMYLVVMFNGERVEFKFVDFSQNSGADLTNVAFKNQENKFTEDQEIQDGNNFRLSGENSYAILRQSGDEMVLEIRRNLLNELKATYIFTGGSFITDNKDLGDVSQKWKELFLSSYANVLGIKSVENSANKVFASDGSVVDLFQNKELGFALGDETSDIEVGTSVLTFQMPNYATTLLWVSVNVKTAPTGSSAIFDLNEGVSSVLSTKISIDAEEKNSEDSSIPPVISDATIAANAIMTMDIDQIGSTIAGTAPKVWIYYKRT